MANIKSERRNHPRRIIKLPIALFSFGDGERIGEFCFGEILDASVDGVKVILNKVCEFKVGDKFVIYAMNQMERESVPPVEIRAVLVWQDRDSGSLGMKLMHGEN